MARSSLTWAASGNSPTSSRNNVPPEASTNLPTWRSVAPVKDPFSWPNRIDSVRFFGIAPASDRNDRLRPALAGAVDRARDELLADAGFAGDQHWDGGGRRFLRHA